MSSDDSIPQNSPAVLFPADPITGAEQVRPITDPAAQPARDDRHEPVQEILDDVHEFIELSAPEIRIFDHPALIRLKRLKQLGLADLVFPTATHVRREHSLGTLHVAHLMLEHLDQNIRRVDGRSMSKEFPADDRKLTRAERVFTRLSALVHDMGHLPSGHTFEDELGLTEKHDHSARLRLILDRDPQDWDASGSDARPSWEGLPHDELPSSAFSLRELIDEEFADVAAEAGLGLTASEIVILIVGGDETTVEAANELDSRMSAANARNEAALFRLGVCRDIVSNTVSADLIDYLHR
ncbi:MAG: HD domain-containing protein, partial [Solirubrobacteraceae bacterium]